MREDSELDPALETLARTDAERRERHQRHAARRERSDRPGRARRRHRRGARRRLGPRAVVAAPAGRARPGVRRRPRRLRPRRTGPGSATSTRAPRPPPSPRPGGRSSRSRPTSTSPTPGPPSPAPAASWVRDEPRPADRDPARGPRELRRGAAAAHPLRRQHVDAPERRRHRDHRRRRRGPACGDPHRAGPRSSGRSSPGSSSCRGCTGRATSTTGSCPARTR